jgi:hypothetical protein
MASSMRENLPVRLSLLAELMLDPDTIDDPVLLKMDDCIWANLVLLIYSKLFIFYVTNNRNCLSHY